MQNLKDVMKNMGIIVKDQDFQKIIEKIQKSEITNTDELKNFLSTLDIKSFVDDAMVALQQAIDAIKNNK